MKCITLSGYLFFKSLGTGVERTTSPNEENLIINIFKLFSIYFILLLIFPTSSIKSQDNLETIVHQKKRIEFEIDYLSRNYWISSNNDNLLLVRDYETGKELDWKISLLNKKLNIEKDTILNLDRSYNILKIKSDNSNFYILYKNNYSNDKEYLLLKYNAIENRTLQTKIKFPLSLKIVDILIYQDKIVFYSSTKNGKNLVSIYNVINNQLNNIYEYLYTENTILYIDKLDNNNFFVLVSEKGSNTLNQLERRVYNLDGEKLASLKLLSYNNSLINSKLLDVGKYTYSISLFSDKNSIETKGIQFDKIFENRIISSRLINFLEINSFKNFISRDRKKISKKLKSNKIDKIKLSYQFYLDSIFSYEDKLIITLEALKPDFTNDGFSNYSYKPFYNSYSGTYDTKVNPNFGGFNHNLGMIISLSLEGNISWCIVQNINSLNTFYKKPYNNYIISKENASSFYVNKGDIIYSSFDYDNELIESNILNINPINKNDIIVNTETNPEGTYLWYKNNYYTYGIQKIKSSELDIKKNRKVFFITNFEIVK